ncbi:MAG: hypothetical protein MHPSP_003094, partial [Paramarteilia canceri]
ENLDKESIDIAHNWCLLFPSCLLSFLISITDHPIDDVAVSGWQSIHLIFEYPWFLDEVLKKKKFNKLTEIKSQYLKRVEDLRYDILNYFLNNESSQNKLSEIQREEIIKYKKYLMSPQNHFSIASEAV